MMPSTPGLVNAGAMSAGSFNRPDHDAQEPRGRGAADEGRGA